MAEVSGSPREPLDGGELDGVMLVDDEACFGCGVGGSGREAHGRGSGRIGLVKELCRGGAFVGEDGPESGDVVCPASESGFDVVGFRDGERGGAGEESGDCIGMLKGLRRADGVDGLHSGG